MAYAYNSHGHSTASTSSSSFAPVTRSRTGLFLSYRDTAIRSAPAAVSKRYPGTRSNAKGKGRAYDAGDDEEERSGLLAEEGLDGDSMANGMTGHEAIQMDTLPPRWSAASDNGHIFSRKS